MLVSVIMPSYNSSRYLKDTLYSVINQTYINWQLIIVDDCSQDDSVKIIREIIKDDSRITLVCLERNSGAAAARNVAIELAKGRFIAFLDSDDIWHPQKLQKQIEFMMAGNHPITCTAYEKMNFEGEPYCRMGVPERLSYSDLMKSSAVGCLTVIYDVDALSKVFMPTNSKREDLATWLVILKRTPFIYCMNEVLAYYRVHPMQSSSKKFSMARENWHLYRSIEKVGLFKSSYYFIHYAIRGVLRLKFPRLARFLRVLY